MAKPWVLLFCMAFPTLLIRAVTQRLEISQTSNDAFTPVSIDIDLARGHPVASTLFGIFFEEVRLGDN